MRLIKKLSDNLQAIHWEVGAIEMSPQFHMQLLAELIAVQASGGNDSIEFNDLVFMGIPIVFIHESSDYFKMLNKEQYKLRIKYNNLLRIYQEKYSQLKIFINHSYKIENAIATEGAHLNELNNLVGRLNHLNDQIRLLSQ